MSLLYGSFDVRFALSALYLWLLFGYLSSMVSCDMQRLMASNLFFRHFVGIISFVLLFTTLDRDHHDDIGTTWYKTIVVYAVFLLLTKAKWYYSIPVLCLIVLDQSLAAQAKYLRKVHQHEETPGIDSMRDKILYVGGALTVVGFLHYGVRQYNEFGKDFSLFRLVFTNANCKL